MYKKMALCIVVTAIVVMIIMSYEFPASVHLEHIEPDCLDSYSDFCISPDSPDLNCSDIAFSNFAVHGNDPHNFDGDNDGIGCETAPTRQKQTESIQIKPEYIELDCLDSYPDFCIPLGTPDLNCPDISFSNFAVRGSDPHGFDADNDGIGCETAPTRQKQTEPVQIKPEHTVSDCLSSYPDFCIPPGPPDLNCSDIRQSDFTVRGSDPHGFDRDNDGIGCES